MTASCPLAEREESDIYRIMDNAHETMFHLTTGRAVRSSFYLAVAVSAGVAAWSFASGFVWTGICMAAVGIPMALLFWYMFHVNPSRAIILVDADGIRLSAPPFLIETVPFDQIVGASRDSLKKGKGLWPEKTIRGMRVGSYRTGQFRLANGTEATIMADSGRVLVVETHTALYLLGPKNLDKLEQTISKHLS
mgnify:FL=1